MSTLLGPDNVPSFIIYYTFNDVSATTTKSKDTKDNKKIVANINSNATNTTASSTNISKQQKKAEVPIVAKAAAAAAVSIDPKKAVKQPAMPPPQGFPKSPNTKTKSTSKSSSNSLSLIHI